LLIKSVVIEQRAYLTMISKIRYPL